MLNIPSITVTKKYFLKLVSCSIYKDNRENEKIRLELSEVNGTLFGSNCPLKTF